MPCSAEPNMTFALNKVNELIRFFGSLKRPQSLYFSLGSNVGLLRRRRLLLVTMTEMQILASVLFDFSGPGRRCVGSEFPARQVTGPGALQTGWELVIAWSIAW